MPGSGLPAFGRGPWVISLDPPHSHRETGPSAPFTEGDAEAERGSVPCPRSHGKATAKQGVEPWPSAFRAQPDDTARLLYFLQVPFPPPPPPPSPCPLPAAGGPATRASREQAEAWLSVEDASSAPSVHAAGPAPEGPSVGWGGASLVTSGQTARDVGREAG